MECSHCGNCTYICLGNVVGRSDVWWYECRQCGTITSAVDDGAELEEVNLSDIGFEYGPELEPCN